MLTLFRLGGVGAPASPRCWTRHWLDTYPALRALRFAISLSPLDNGADHALHCINVKIDMHFFVPHMMLRKKKNADIKSRLAALVTA